MALPALLAGIAEPLLSMADTYFVGHIPLNAKASLAAVSLVGVFLSMLIWVLGQVRSGVSTLVSQYFGGGRLEQIEDLIPQAILAVTVLSLLLIAITYPIAPAIFRLYNADDHLLELSVLYYRIRVFGLPFTLVTFVIFGTFRGLQNTSYPMWIALSGTLINIVLDKLFIFGWANIIPAMNIRGAAYASLIAQVVMAVSAVFFMLRKTPVRLKFTLSFHPEMKRLMHMVFQLFVRTLALNVALYFGSSFATRYGNTALAAYGIALQIWFFYAFFIDGYSGAGNILAGKLYGAKAFDRLKKLGQRMLRYGLGVGVVLMAVSFVFYTYFGRFFIDNREVQQLFYSFFWMVALMQPVNAVAFIYDGIFKGLGYMTYLKRTLLISSFLGFIPVLYLLDYLGWRMKAIWSAFFVWMMLRGGFLLVKFYRMAKNDFSEKMR